MEVRKWVLWPQPAVKAAGGTLCSSRSRHREREGGVYLVTLFSLSNLGPRSVCTNRTEQSVRDRSGASAASQSTRCVARSVGGTPRAGTVGNRVTTSWRYTHSNAIGAARR